MPVIYGCGKFLDSMSSLNSILERLAKSLTDKDFLYLKQEFGQNWHLFTKNLAFPNEHFKTVE